MHLFFLRNNPHEEITAISRKNTDTLRKAFVFIPSNIRKTDRLVRLEFVLSGLQKCPFQVSFTRLGGIASSSGPFFVVLKSGLSITTVSLMNALALASIPWVLYPSCHSLSVR